MIGTPVDPRAAREAGGGGGDSGSGGGDAWAGPAAGRRPQPAPAGGSSSTALARASDLGPITAARLAANRRDEVRDEDGRRRFHGAFTGGWSAGYFNTVGSKEGWAPATFTSSRATRAGGVKQSAADFMDEEDAQDLGLGSFAAQDAYDTMGIAGLRAGRSAAAAAAGGSSSGGVAETLLSGAALPAELIAPVSQPMGDRLLRALGWRDGQALGPRHASGGAGSSAAAEAAAASERARVAQFVAARTTAAVPAAGRVPTLALLTSGSGGSSAAEEEDVIASLWAAAAALAANSGEGRLCGVGYERDRLPTASGDERTGARAAASSALLNKRSALLQASSGGGGGRLRGAPRLPSAPGDDDDDGYDAAIDAAVAVEDDDARLARAPGRRLLMGQTAAAATAAGVGRGGTTVTAGGSRARGGGGPAVPRVSFDEDGDADVGALYGGDEWSQYDTDLVGSGSDAKRRRLAGAGGGAAAAGGSRLALTDGASGRPLALTDGATAAAAPTTAEPHRERCSDGRPPPQGFHVAVAVERPARITTGRVVVPPGWVPIHRPGPEEKTGLAAGAPLPPPLPPQQPSPPASSSTAARSRFGPQLPPSQPPPRPPARASATDELQRAASAAVLVSRPPVSDKFTSGGHLGPGGSEGSHEALTAVAGLRPGAKALPPVSTDAVSASSSSASSAAAAAGVMGPAPPPPSAAAPYRPEPVQLAVGASHRTTAQWVPAKLLLRRLGVPDPLTKDARAAYEAEQQLLQQRQRPEDAARAGGGGAPAGAAGRVPPTVTAPVAGGGGGAADGSGRHWQLPEQQRGGLNGGHSAGAAAAAASATLLPLAAPHAPDDLLRRVFG